MAELLSKDKFEFASVYWTALPYFSKVSLQKIKDKVEVFLISYKVKDRILQGLIIEPVTKSENHPALIYNRGGNNIDPSKSDMGLTFATMGGASLFDLVIKHNYIIYTSQLSGYGENSGKDEFGGEDLNDILELKDLIDQNEICNSSRIGMLGYSRGGMMSYLSLINSDWLKTIAVVGAPSNLIRNAQERPEMQKVFEETFGGSDNEKKKRSILFNSDKLPKDSNILMLHGETDDRVNYRDSEELAERLKSLNINNKLKLFDEGSHSLIENRGERDNEILEWFNKYL